jgi:hypothetical protein
LDPICQGIVRWTSLTQPITTFSFSQHTNYHEVGDGPGQDTYPLDAAKFFAARVRPAPPSSGPEATITPIDGAVPGKPFLLSAGESSDPTGRPLTYAWDLDGSGRYATTTDGDILETSFAATGDYPIGLKVTNDAGQSAVATTSVHVAPPGLYTEVPNPPTAITWTPAADHESGTLSWQPPASGPLAEGYEVVTADGRLVAVINHGGPAAVLPKDSDLPLTVSIRSFNRRGAGPASAQVRLALPTEVMVVGDSISQGSAGDFTWRYRFDKHETAAGASFPSSARATTSSTTWPAPGTTSEGAGRRLAAHGAGYKSFFVELPVVLVGHAVLPGGLGETAACSTIATTNVSRAGRWTPSAWSTVPTRWQADGKRRFSECVSWVTES